jgi:hypothetical protein
MKLIIKPEYEWKSDSHLTSEYLQQYGNGNNFVETGTYHGDTVKLALQFGYQKIYSCELNKELYDNCVKMFEGNSNVKIFWGDSIDCLHDIIKELDGPATFWLDAHASGPLVGGKSGGSPVVDELKIIKSHGRTDHTIFIDDRRLFGCSEWSFVKESDAMAVLQEINPNYNIHYLDAHQPKDVICATVRT